MRRAIFALLAATVVASSTGCCCLDRLFCWGCRGGCGYGYGHEGPCQSCGYSGGGGCADCGAYGGPAGGPMGPSPMQGMAKRRPAQGHPFVQQRRDADGEYEFAAGPPTGSTTYPYYTNRGPRDFLARNPRSIGP